MNLSESSIEFRSVLVGLRSEYACGLHLTGVCGVPPTWSAVYLSNVFGTCPEKTALHSRPTTTYFPVDIPPIIIGPLR